MDTCMITKPPSWLAVPFVSSVGAVDGLLTHSVWGVEIQLVRLRYPGGRWQSFFAIIDKASAQSVFITTKSKVCRYISDRYPNTTGTWENAWLAKNMCCCGGSFMEQSWFKNVCTTCGNSYECAISLLQTPKGLKKTLHDDNN